MLGQVTCPHCRQVVVSSPELAGQVVQCPSCRGQFQMPSVPVAAIPTPQQSYRSPRRHTNQGVKSSALWIPAVFLFFGLMVVACGGLLLLGSGNKLETNRVRTGNVVGIYSPGKNDVLAGATSADLDRLTQLSVAGDEIGVKEMILQRRAFLLEYAVPVRVLSRTILQAEVRVQAGRHENRVVFVSTERLAPFQEDDKKPTPKS